MKRLEVKINYDQENYKALVQTVRKLAEKVIKEEESFWIPSGTTTLIIDVDDQIAIIILNSSAWTAKDITSVTPINDYCNFLADVFESILSAYQANDLGRDWRGFLVQAQKEINAAVETWKNEDFDNYEE